MKKNYALCFVFLLFVCAIFSFVGCDNPFIQDVLDNTQNNSNLPNLIDEFSIGDILFSDGTCMKVEDVNRLLKQYEQMKKMFKQMNSKGGRRRRMPNLPGMNNMGGFGGF